ncbi:hypothetical protein [Mycobacterium sp. E2479]|uniref:hypothetical protein n=1 Tax=Mycobacterium sp. E2479 TaxID=1834134 RepID=UPI00080013A9|nr:hypothetical protein [Mycobacterium sp. E2479]OBH50256.1 hypothetical protein A5686_14240 [Mycobacterium sp. E2479]
MSSDSRRPARDRAAGGLLSLDGVGQRSSTNRGCLGRRLDDALGAGFALITTVRPTAVAQASPRYRGFVVLIPKPGDVLATWLRGAGQP